MLCFAREAHAGRLEDGGLSDGDDGAADGGGSEDGGALMGPPALPKGGMATVRGHDSVVADARGRAGGRARGRARVCCAP